MLRGAGSWPEALLAVTRAREDVKAALARFDGHPRALLERALVIAQEVAIREASGAPALARARDARSAFDAAVAAASRDPRAFAERGLFRLERGDDGGREDLVTAQGIGPGPGLAKRIERALSR